MRLHEWRGWHVVSALSTAPPSSEPRLASTEERGTGLSENAERGVQTSWLNKVLSGDSAETPGLASGT